MPTALSSHRTLLFQYHLHTSFTKFSPPFFKKIDFNLNIISSERSFLTIVFLMAPWCKFHLLCVLSSGLFIFSLTFYLLTRVKFIKSWRLPCLVLCSTPASGTPLAHGPSWMNKPVNEWQSWDKHTGQLSLTSTHLLQSPLLYSPTSKNIYSNSQLP